jgi:hypothetical protein
MIHQHHPFDIQSVQAPVAIVSPIGQEFVIGNTRRRLITTETDIVPVSCYLRHLDDVVTATGVKIGPDNRKEIDRTVKELLGLEDCPDVWKEVKKRLAADEQGFINDLHDAFVMKGLI